MSAAVRLLMCRPDFYGVDYVINPWMEGNIHRASRPLAHSQWQTLLDTVSKWADVELIEPCPGLPDMVFTANAGLVAGARFIPSRFFHSERRGEETQFLEWFESRGFGIAELPAGLPFEGAGDAFFDAERQCLWAAYGSRTELLVHPRLAELLAIEVVSLRLVDSRYYHLDTCFCLPGNGRLLYYPPAFDPESRQRIEERVPASRRITVSAEDAANFACNAIPLEGHVILNSAGSALREELARAHLETVEVPLTEFLKSGGAAKCLVLDLAQTAPENTAAHSAVVTKRIEMEGHLLDTGVLERALDLSVQGGGSFRVERFELGRQRQSPSSTSVEVSAPSEWQLDRVVTQLIELGARVSEPAAVEAHLEPVELSGVAPDGFYATTIYPTDVHLGGRWIRAERQRMDAVLVAAPRHDAVQCRLISDLVPGDNVVVGSAGIRTSHPAARRDEPDLSRFGFMSAGVSSERRVELLVERISWEMRRIRERDGRIAVVAGPVVIHTGAGSHLAWLIRNGFVQLLLGGNAVATHDIEQALFGTSLGIDMERGVPVRGGHRHHLAAINTIRRCGGIQAAVDAGVLTRGVMFECVQHGIPFSLAGSIRDDGPLPETRMDLLQAQREHANLLEGTEMILMLSSMLHSIGVGNMTPAGVSIVCVDINPAVVTKLADRGSLESRGVVTDVGLFLSLLVRRLRALEKKTTSNEPASI